MGRRGPVPKPSAVLQMQGTYRPHRRRGEPQPIAGRPRCPEWLDKEAKVAWRQLVPMLESMGVLTRVDGNALARYCQLLSRWKKAELFLQKHGEVYALKDEQGNTRCLVQVPQVAIANKLAQTLTRMEQEFGLMPSARARIHLDTQLREPSDLAQFLGLKEVPYDQWSEEYRREET